MTDPQSPGSPEPAAQADPPEAIEGSSEAVSEAPEAPIAEADGGAAEADPKPEASPAPESPEAAATEASDADATPIEAGDDAESAGEEAIAAAVEAEPAPAPAPDEPSAEVAPPAPPSRRRRRLRLVATFVVAFLIAALIGSTVGAAAMYAYHSAYDGRVPQGVDVAGIDIGGLSVAEAEALIAANYSSLTQGRIVLDAPSGDRVIDYSDFARSVDAAGAVQRAMAVANGSDLLGQTLASARVAMNGVSITPTVALDPTRLQYEIERAARTYEVPPVDAVVKPTAQGTEVDPARNGRTVDAAPILELALAAVSSMEAPGQVTIPVTEVAVAPTITDALAEQGRQAVERMAAPISVRHGDEKWTIPAKTVRTWLLVDKSDAGQLVYDVDRAKVAESVKKLRGKIDRKPVNASYLTSKAGRVIGVKASRNGRTIDTAVTSERVARAVISRAYGVESPTATAVIKAVEPKITTAEAQKTAPLLKMISAHTTWFPYGERNFFGANIWIPGRIINGMVLAPGETFDFWKVVGYPSPSRGFGAGGAIINGRTEPTGALAGGICSCSTTLYNTAAKAGLKLGARKMHYYYIDRYPLGLDATVWISGGSRQNLTFTNDTKHPILIVNRNWRSGGRGYVRFEMWSVPNGRRVRFSKPIVRNVRPATTSVVYTSALRPGTSRQEESEHDGMDVWVTRTVTDAKGKVIHKDTIRSHYARVNGLILRGKAAGSSGATQ